MNTKASRHPTPLTSLASELNLDAEVSALLSSNPSKKPDEYVAEADFAKSSDEFQKAAVHYLAAIKLDRAHMFARYQLACDLCLWGKQQLAIDLLEGLMNDGFWGYEMMRGDDDLEGIQQTAEFQSFLVESKKRYDQEAHKHAGHNHLRVPQAAAPPDGWPLLVFLHGFGDNADNYLAQAETAAENRFAGLAVSGPVVQWDNRYAWPVDSFVTTDAYLDTVIGQFKERKDLDRSRVFLCGFSQGAEHAFGVLASNPRKYSGAIVLSPGGAPFLPNQVVTSSIPRPVCLVCGTQEHPATLKNVQHCQQLCRDMKWPVLNQTHPGRHHFPEDWDERFPKILKWLSDPKEVAR